jgi:hypothetical protein
LRAVGAFSQLRLLSQSLKPVRLFETPIPAQAICLGVAIIKSNNHVGL